MSRVVDLDVMRSWAHVNMRRHTKDRVSFWLIWGFSYRGICSATLYIVRADYKLDMWWSQPLRPGGRLRAFVGTDVGKKSVAFMIWREQVLLWFRVGRRG